MRLRSYNLLQHPYLWENPPPADPAMLPKLPPSHEKDMKDLREAANKSQSGPASAHGKRRHSDADGVRYPADAGPSQRYSLCLTTTDSASLTSCSLVTGVRSAEALWPLFSDAWVNPQIPIIDLGFALPRSSTLAK